MSGVTLNFNHLLIQFLQEKEDMDFAMRERPCVVEVRTYDAV